jgi:hypothetical protein
MGSATRRLAGLADRPGLVWLDWTLLTGADLTYPGAITTSAAFDNGFTGWRLPTLNEATTAVANGLPQHCPLTNGPGPDGDLWWSSTTAKGGKYAYAVNLTKGASQLVLISSKLGQQVSYSALYGMFVRVGTL